MTSMSTVEQARWPTDVTRFCQKLARRLARDGVEHPEAAAVALAMRGRRGLTTDEYAEELGLPPATLEAVEDGRIPIGDLPGVVLEAARAIDGLDLDALPRESGLPS